MQLRATPSRRASADRRVAFSALSACGQLLLPRGA